MKLIRSLGKKAVRNFVTAPWNSPIMEFRYGIWRGISPLFSQSGRQLGEENTRPFLFNDHISATTIPCKYEGSRFGHNINMSALRIAMSNFDEALDITAAVSNYHAQALRQSLSSESAGIWDLYIISRASIALIAFDIRRAKKNRKSKNQSSKSRSWPIVSDVLASQYQFIAGVFMICRHMINHNHSAIQTNTPITAETLYAYADRHEIFTSFNGMVCAGSTAKIMQFLHFCCEQTASTPASQDNNIQLLTGIIENPEKWYRYALSTIEFDCFLELSHLQKKHHTNSGLSQTDQGALHIYEQIKKYCAMIGNLPNSEGIDGYEAGALMRQNRILHILDRPPLQTISPKYLLERIDY